eukprot:8797512-Pyramimonas_sp.AAC.1
MESADGYSGGCSSNLSTDLLCAHTDLSAFERHSDLAQLARNTGCISTESWRPEKRSHDISGNVSILGQQ